MAEETEIIIKGQFKDGKVLISETEKLDKNITSIGFSSQQTEKQSNSLFRSLKKLGAVVGIGLLANQFKKLVTGSLQAAGAMEQVDIALTTIIGSADDAAKLQKDLIEFAKKTPFEIQGIFRATTQLVGYGIAQEDIIKTMSNLGNIAAGVGVDMNRLAVVYGQVKTKGKLLADDLNQFTEAGVPLLDALANTLDTTTASVVKMKEAGEISFEDMKAALESLTAAGGQFHNLMDSQSKAFLGTLSNMNDSFYQVQVALGKALLPVARKVISEMAQGFDDLLVTVKENKEAITATTDFLVTGFVGIGRAVKDAFFIIFASFKGLFIIFDGFGTRLANMMTRIDIWGAQFKKVLLELGLEFMGLISGMIAQIERLSSIPGFGFAKTLSDNFTAAKDSIINDIAEIENAVQIMNESLLARQEAQNAAELELKQQKVEDDLAVEEEEKERSIAIREHKTELQKKADESISKFEKVQESKRYKGAAKAADALVALQNSKNKELAAIGKAAAIFQITNDSATGAMAAYKGMVSAIPGPVGVSLGVAAAAAVIAYGVEQVANVTSNSYAVGTPNIPVDQIAQVHKGEMIIPATFSEAIRSGELSLSGGGNEVGSSTGFGVNINIDLDGAQFIGQMDDDDIAMIGERLGEMINENLITAIPTRTA